jgi:hypothetical protein
VEQATSATSQLIDRLLSYELREGKGFQRESVREFHHFAVEAVAQLSAIVVELADQLDQLRSAAAQPGASTAAATTIDDPLVRTTIGSAPTTTCGSC